MYGSRWRAIAVVTNVWRSGGRSRVTRPQRSEASHPAAPLFVTSALNVCITETEWYMRRATSSTEASASSGAHRAFTASSHIFATTAAPACAATDGESAERRPPTNWRCTLSTAAVSAEITCAAFAFAASSDAASAPRAWRERTAEAQLS